MNDLKQGDKVRFRGMPGLGTGIFRRYEGRDAYNDQPLRAVVNIEGLDEGRAFLYDDRFSPNELIKVSR